MRYVIPPRVVVHASLSQAMVNRLVYITAQHYGIRFADARLMLERRWAEEARVRINRNLSTFKMWEEMVVMARRATPWGDLV